LNPSLGRVLSALNSYLSRCSLLALAFGLCLALPAAAEETDSAALQALALERDLIAAELEQLQKTVALLQGSTRDESANSSAAVQRLHTDIKELKAQLIVVSQKEISLLQSELAAAPAGKRTRDSVPPPQSMESKPLPATPNYSYEVEQAQVARLHRLLAQHKEQQAEDLRTLPTDEELVARKAANLDANRLARIPFNPGKVRLSGAEGSTALAQISERLSDTSIPESRRDSTPLASIKTYLFGSLIASESRSLRPVGKNHYVTKIHLQPGDTTVRMQGYRWEISLPNDIHTSQYLITLYKPPGAVPEFHIFSIEELLAVENAHIPAWLPRDLGIADAG
jgi:hypothetical protein